MQYENRQPSEGLNVTEESPVKRLLILTGSALILVSALYFAFMFLGGWFARFIPFSAEVAVVEALDIDFTELTGAETGPDFSDREAALNELASRVMAHLDMPDGMDITVHYVEEDVFNAFATLGGHVFFYRGLIEKMPHENALAMVMAHEIAHEIHRDPISGLGGGVTASIMLQSVLGNAGRAADVLNVSTVVGGATFTRGMEERADTAAIAAVNGLYGHVFGADSLFKVLANSSRSGDDDLSGWASKFLRTHPLDNDRVDAIAEAADQHGWLTQGDTTPLDPSLASLFKDSSSTD